MNDNKVKIDFFRTIWSMLLFKYFMFFCSQCCNLHGRTFLNNIFFQKIWLCLENIFNLKTSFINIFISEKNYKKRRFCLTFLFLFVFENDYLKQRLLFRFQTKTTSMELVVSFSVLKKRNEMTKRGFFQKRCPTLIIVYTRFKEYLAIILNTSFKEYLAIIVNTNLILSLKNTWLS